MSKKLDAMLSEVEGLLSAANAVSAKKKPQPAAANKSAKATASAKASAVEADVVYSPKNKMYLRKLQRLVDRGYLLPEEVGGAVFEALHMAKVSNRMAGAIASKVQEALMSAEPDVVDVSARARRK
jgi:hypothetical protein